MFIPLTPPELARRKAQALRWACAHAHAAHLDAHGEAYPYGPFPQLTAAGAKAIYAGREEAFSPPDGHFWLGAISYDYGCGQLGKPVEGGAGFDFFAPEQVLLWQDGGVKVVAPDPARTWEQVCSMEVGEGGVPKRVSSRQSSRIDYDAAIAAILSYLHKGEAYEVNFCRWEKALLAATPHLAVLYERLVGQSPMPFQFLYQTPGMRMAGSSPERFLRREGNRLISQPIKGTARRGGTPDEDNALKAALRTDEKTLAENMMIADLVRNDLAQACLPGSVEVEELFGAYTFRQLHQLITTISGKLEGPTDWPGLLRATFPMGSMTGAPKGRALDIIAETEDRSRGYFSGTFGYVRPDGDFDLAVLIRTLFADGKHIHYQAGGAIVWDSETAQEWDEAELKMAGMRKAAMSYEL